MQRLLLSALILLLPVPAALADAPVAAQAAKPAKHFEYLDPADFDPARLLPAPEPRGSALEKIELDRIHAMIAGASPARLAQATWDAQHETPAIFDEAAGHDLAALPQTWALLQTVKHEAAIAATFSKLYFARYRPYAVDPTLHDCEGLPHPAQMSSYPSGHATLGFSVGLVLARLMPERAPAILARAADYGLSREYCGSHFSSDTAASHVIGTLVAVRLLADPRLADHIAAARAELARP